MIQKFLLAQAINIASYTIAEMMRTNRDKFSFEHCRPKIHEAIRAAIKPTFLGEKNIEDKVIKVANWFLDRLISAEKGGADIIVPLANLLTAGNTRGAVELIQQFAKKVLNIGDSPSSEQGSDAQLVQAYLEENPGEVTEEKEEGGGGQSQPQINSSAPLAQAVSVTDSMQPPQTYADAERGQGPVIKGNEEIQAPTEKTPEPQAAEEAQKVSEKSQEAVKEEQKAQAQKKK